VDSAAVVTTSTSTGTALYMAPEQKTAADTVGPPADLYAVTAIFYELLIGVAPGGRWVPVSKEREDLPPGIDTVIEKGLSSRPRNRYQNAQEYFRALHEMRTGPAPRPAPVPQPQPVQPVQPFPPPTPPKKSSIKKWILIGVTVFFVLWLIGALTKIGTNNGGGSNSDGGNNNNGGGKNIPPPPPPPPPPDANFSGAWYDELEGSGIAQYKIVLIQNGKLVTGSIYQMNGFYYGSISGFVNGKVFDYKYATNFGSGWGRGTMASDGDIDILVNGVEKHVMHRGHMPG
jgi:serine/threonine protein kinase